jgi:1,4-alpha-glucan branching enzyme
LLLSPHIPLLFMGEEYGETRPFLFFTDFHGDLARAVREGRAKEFAGHSGHDGEDVPDPNALETFTRSRLDWQTLTTEAGKSWLRFTRELLRLRHLAIVPLLAGSQRCDGHVLHTAPGHIAVSWHFAQGTLSMALNISVRTLPWPDFPGQPQLVWPVWAVTH